MDWRASSLIAFDDQFEGQERRMPAMIRTIL